MHMPKVLLFLMLMVTASAALAGSLRVTGDRLFIPIEINSVHAEALLDSAAEMTLIDASFAKRLVCKRGR